MSGIVKLDDMLVGNRLGWKSEVETGPGVKARYTPGYLGIYAGVDWLNTDIEKVELVRNSEISLPLDCSVAPAAGGYNYHALLAPNPKLAEVAQITMPTLLLPGSDRLRPILHLRGLKKFDLTQFDWVVSIHLLG